MSTAEEAKIVASSLSSHSSLAQYDSITLTYSCEMPINLAVVEQEFESGACFSLYHDHEDLICEPAASATNVRVDACQGGFSVTVTGAFLPRSLRFTRLATSFLANLLDFGSIRLEHIAIDQSDSIKPPKGEASTALPAAAFGTVVKPYFRLSHEERADLIVRLADEGFDLVKEDECHIVTEDEILRNVTALAGRLSNEFSYVPNKTGIVNNDAAIRNVVNSGARVVMVNALITGLQSVSDLATRFPCLSIWVHRVGYAAIESIISRQAFTQLAVLSGASMIHVGTPISSSDIIKVSQFAPFAFGAEGVFRPVFTKLTPEVLQLVSTAFGSSAVYMVCGWIREPHTALLDVVRLKQWQALADEVKRIHRGS